MPARRMTLGLEQTRNRRLEEHFQDPVQGNTAMECSRRRTIRNLGMDKSTEVMGLSSLHTDNPLLTPSNKLPL